MLRGRPNVGVVRIITLNRREGRFMTRCRYSGGAYSQRSRKVQWIPSRARCTTIPPLQNLSGLNDSLADLLVSVDGRHIRIKDSRPNWRFPRPFLGHVGGLARRKSLLLSLGRVVRSRTKSIIFQSKWRRRHSSTTWFPKVLRPNYHFRGLPSN